MTRTFLAKALGLIALIAAPVLIGVSSIGSQGHDDGETVRIMARLRADGDIEFGLRTSAGNQLPRQRIFSASISDDGWKISSLIEVPDGTEVRIMARRDGATRVEFGLRIDEPRQVFLPRQRFFPRSSTVGRWRVSTPIPLPAPHHDEVEQEAPTPEPDEPAPPPEPPEEESEDTGAEEPEEASDDAERISFGHREGLIVNRNVIGDPDAPVLIAEYGDPY